MVQFFLLLTLLLAYTNSVAAQQLQKSTHVPRHSDTVCRREMAYKSPGRDGENVVWDFSQLPPISTKRYEEYRNHSDSTLLLWSDNSIYHYRIQNDSLLCIGYDLPTTKIRYLTPLCSMVYPLNLGDSISSIYYGEGTYGKTLNIAMYGKSDIKADASGVLILPEGDTLTHVIRIKETQYIGQKSSAYPDVFHTKRQLTSSDSIEQYLKQDSLSWKVEKYLWYALGYRYPIFETIRSFIITHGKELPHFDKSYFYSPHEQIAANIDILNDSIREKRNILSNQEPHISRPKNSNYPFNYNCFLKDHNKELQVELFLKARSQVEISISNIRGMLLHRIPKQTVENGFNQFSIPLPNNHSTDVLILSINVNGETKTHKILNL